MYLPPAAPHNSGEELLPKELWQQIFSNLSRPADLNAASCCKLFHQLVVEQLSQKQTRLQTFQMPLMARWGVTIPVTKLIRAEEEARELICCFSALFDLKEEQQQQLERYLAGFLAYAPKEFSQAWQGDLQKIKSLLSKDLAPIEKTLTAVLENIVKKRLHFSSILQKNVKLLYMCDVIPDKYGNNTAYHQFKTQVLKNNPEVADIFDLADRKIKRKNRSTYILMATASIFWVGAMFGAVNLVNFGFCAQPLHCAPMRNICYNPVPANVFPDGRMSYHSIPEICSPGPKHQMCDSPFFIVWNGFTLLLGLFLILGFDYLHSRHGVYSSTITGTVCAAWKKYRA